MSKKRFSLFNPRSKNYVLGVLCLGLLTCSCTDSSNPRIAQGSRIMGNYVGELNKKKEWMIHNVNVRIADQINTIDVDLVKKKEVDLEEARRLVISASESLLEKIREGERANPQLYAEPFDPENLHFSFLFLQPNGEYVENNKIANVNIIKGSVVFRTHENNHLTELHEETYEEALRLVNLEKHNPKDSL